VDLSLYVVTTDVEEMGRTHVDVAREAGRGGATVVQFRQKGFDRMELAGLALAVKDVAHAAGALFIVNDDPELARTVGADGAHVGRSDMRAGEARSILGPDAILGVSATCAREAAEVDPDLVDYVGLGPIFPTPSKADATAPIGLDGLEKAVRLCPVPIVAIGGISARNVAGVIEAGAAGIAVISAVASASDMDTATRDLARRIRLARARQQDDRETSIGGPVCLESETR